MLKDKIKHLSQKYFPQVLALRRQLHAQPELSWHEEETSKLVADTLTQLGITVTRPVLEQAQRPTGVVGILQGKNPDKKCIALRADMDALPIHETNEVPYCSTRDGIMHACGHDVHTSNLLGVAMILSELKDEWEGTIKFIFQPSEEKIPSGAEAMIRAGVLQNPAPSKIFGLHVSPELEAGTFGFCSGRFMASSDEIYLTVTGRGGHAARIDEINNPLLMAAEILIALRYITKPEVPVILSFGKIEGKGATNVVPDTVEIAGTLRCFSEELRQETHQLIYDVCHHLAQKLGGSCRVNILKGYPVLINDEAVTTAAKRHATDYAGAENIHDLPTRMGSEDFAYYTHHVPACFYRLGVGNSAKGITASLHTSSFNIDEDALQHSIGLMSWLAINA